MSRHRFHWSQGPVLLAVAVASLLAGYGLNDLQRQGSGNLTSRELDSEALRTAQLSFSELENTRAELDQKAQELALGARWFARQTTSASPASQRTAAPRRERAMRLLEQAALELNGTAQQPLVMAELLLLLQEAKRPSEWLDRYLEMVYRHPEASLIPRFAAVATRFARETQREEEVATALAHHAAIPSRFLRHHAREEAEGVSTLDSTTDGAAGVASDPAGHGSAVGRLL